MCNMPSNTIHEVASDPEILSAISILPSTYNLEIPKTIWRIRREQCSRVALQMPEGLTMFACVISDIIKSYLTVFDRIVSIMGEDIKDLVEKWMKWDKNDCTRFEIQSLWDVKNIVDLKNCMTKKLSFGTAGIRARMGAGFSRLNDLVIIQISRGMLSYALKHCPDLKSRGIVIGYDARHHSDRFAQLAASVFIRAGVKTYLCSRIVPTPLVSYAVMVLGCDLGLMVTASHNPKEDNGYKVYWNNGAQVISPHDVGIVNEMQAQLEPEPGVWDLSGLAKSDLFSDPLESLWQQYIDQGVKDYCYNLEQNKQSSMKFTYTAFHGVGNLYTPSMMQAFGIKPENIVPVKSQVDPDPDFPTVKCPNPEEGREVLQLSFEAADSGGSSFIIANDPDADRLQIAEKQPNGEWYVFTGNEQGGLLAWHVWEGWKGLNSIDKANEVFMINSTVSSKFMQTLGKAEGFNCMETLTGFKWMGNLAQKLRAEGKTVLLAWEESIGYMCGQTLDKDGVLAASIFAELAIKLNAKGLTLAQQLEKLYEKYGYQLNYTNYIINSDPVINEKIFTRLRNFDKKPKTYPKTIGGITVENVRDLTIGYDSRDPNGKPDLPVSSSSEMLTFYLENDATLTLRTSGTEPKIKYYVDCIASSRQAAQNIVDKLSCAAVEDIIQPDIHGLKREHF